ncbi:MAG: InlB B-repeat-containing protein [Clostridiaceae bacterium]|jgi:uncharacterized repeat protein (TIGR02543 family)|nr:InlB B-repeat-containing protein [Clostridiaceae bacterium]
MKKFRSLLIVVLVLALAVTVFAACGSDGDTYRVEFKNGEITLDAYTQTVKSGEKVGKPEVNPTKDGYTFVEWQLDGVAYDFDKAVTGNITLTAKFAINVYDVTFISEEGSIFAVVPVNHGDAVVVPATNPDKEGSTFRAWLAGTADYVLTTPVTGNITLTAAFTLNKQTVTFNDENDKKLSDTQVDWGTTVAEQPELGKTGFDFTGWRLPDGSRFVFTTLVKSDLVLKESYAPISYTVVLKNADGTVYRTDHYIYGDVIEELPARAPETGYHFVAWLLNGTPYTFGTAVTTTGEIELTASYALNVYTVNFKGETGNVITTTNVTHGQTVAEFTAQEKDGNFTFVGWYNEATGTLYDFDAPVTGALNLIATFEIDVDAALAQIADYTGLGLIEEITGNVGTYFNPVPGDGTAETAFNVDEDGNITSFYYYSELYKEDETSRQLAVVSFEWATADASARYGTLTSASYYNGLHDGEFEKILEESNNDYESQYEYVLESIALLTSSAYTVGEDGSYTFTIVDGGKEGVNLDITLTLVFDDLGRLVSFVVDGSEFMISYGENGAVPEDRITPDTDGSDRNWNSYARYYFIIDGQRVIPNNRDAGTIGAYLTPALLNNNTVIQTAKTTAGYLANYYLDEDKTQPISSQGILLTGDIDIYVEFVPSASGDVLTKLAATLAATTYEYTAVQDPGANPLNYVTVRFEDGVLTEVYSNNGIVESWWTELVGFFGTQYSFNGTNYTKALDSSAIMRNPLSEKILDYSFNEALNNVKLSDITITENQIQVVASGTTYTLTLANGLVVSYVTASTWSTNTVTVNYDATAIPAVPTDDEGAPIVWQKLFKAEFLIVDTYNIPVGYFADKTISRYGNADDTEITLTYADLEAFLTGLGVDITGKRIVIYEVRVIRGSVDMMNHGNEISDISSGITVGTTQATYTYWIDLVDAG